MNDRWIETVNGFVNLRHAVRISQSHPADDKQHMRWELRIEMADGLVTRTPPDRYRDLNELLAEIVPATPGQEVVVLYPDQDNEGEVHVSRYAVAGWRLMHGGVAPILVEAIETSHRNLFLVLPDGQLDDAAGTYTMEQAKAEVLERAAKAKISV